MVLYFFCILLFSCKEKQKIVIPEIEKEPKVLDFPLEKVDYDTTLWTEIIEDEFIKLDIRYASDRNFMKQKIYDCGRCFLDNKSYKAFEIARKELLSLGYKVILYDCYRPKPYQQKLWEIMPNAMYVTPPKKGSMHSRGRAIDMGLLDSNNEVIDMGTEYDYFGKEAHYAYPNLSNSVKKNRKILRETMVKHNFKAIRTEWWHFSYNGSKSEFSDWLWDCK